MIIAISTSEPVLMVHYSRSDLCWCFTIILKDQPVSWIKYKICIRFLKGEVDMAYNKDNAILQKTAKVSDGVLSEKDRILLNEIGSFVFFNSPYSIAIYTVLDNGEDFRIDLINGKCEELLGMDLESVRGKNLKEIVPGIADTDYPDALKRVWVTGKSEFIPGRIYFIYNMPVWREVSISKLPNDRLMVFSRNVEEEKNREIEFSTFMKSSLEGIFVSDEDGNYIEVNETASLITGYSRDELLKKNLIEFFREEDKDTAKAHFENLKEKGDEIAIIPFVHKNGNIRWWRVSAFSMEPLGKYIAFVQDITATMESRKKLKKANASLKEAFYNTLKTIAHVVEAKDMYSQGHHERVAELALKICCRMGLEDELGDKVYKAALVHDAGKIKIPTEILNTSRILSEHEHHMIKLHTLYSRDILSGIGLDEDVLEIIEQHHERMDGKGYPRNLQGNQINMGAKILIIANTFDSLCLNKPHRKGLSREKALAEIRETGIAAFDPDVLDAFLNIVEFAEIKT